jgi:hypothetical protein
MSTPTTPEGEFVRSQCLSIAYFCQRNYDNELALLSCKLLGADSITF